MNQGQEHGKHMIAAARQVDERRRGASPRACGAQVPVRVCACVCVYMCVCMCVC